MSILVTGATGLIGANLARLLVARGEKLRLLAREKSDRRGVLGLGCELIVGDVLQPDTIARAMERVDRVYHCVGVVRPDHSSPAEMERVNAEGTRNVVRAAREAGVKRLVHVSSVSAVGHGPMNDPATEDMAFNFDERLTYHRSKRASERIAVEEAGPRTEVVMGNPTVVIGAADVHPSTGKLVLMVARRHVRVFPSGGMNFVNALDVAEGLRLLMEKGRHGERYILGSVDLTWRQFLTLVAEEAGVAPPQVPLPDGVLHGLARFTRFVRRIAPPLARPFPFDYFEQGALTAYASSAKAVRELGYRPGPIHLGVREALRWFREEGFLPPVPGENRSEQQELRPSVSSAQP